MSNTNTIQTEAPASSTKMLRAMVGIGIICALLIVLTFEGTLPIIEKNKAEALEKAIFKVLPGTVTKRTFKLEENNVFSEIISPDKDAQLVYAGYDENGALTGIAVEATGMGFADILRVLYGYDPEKQQIIGFYVLESKETPGLGDKIEKDPNFLANFKALDVSLDEQQPTLHNHIIAVKNGKKTNAWEVDGITGATISSRAIGNLLDASTTQWIPLLYQHKEVFQTPKDDIEKAQQ